MTRWVVPFLLSKFAYRCSLFLSLYVYYESDELEEALKNTKLAAK